MFGPALTNIAVRRTAYTISRYLTDPSCSVIIPIKKISLPEEHTSRPIPTLSDRQFVVTKSKLSTHEEKTQRELFWYREELFKCVHGRWREVSSLSIWLHIDQLTYFRWQSGGTRAGDLSMREQRLSLPMLEALKLETTRVRMTLLNHDDDSQGCATIPRSGDKFLPKPNEFVQLRIQVTNLSCRCLVFELFERFRLIYGFSI